MTWRRTPERTAYWQEECRYIAGVLALERCGVHASEVAVARDLRDPQVFLRYCALQRDAAALEGYHDSATYIGECMDDLETLIKGRTPR